MNKDLLNMIQGALAGLAIGELRRGKTGFRMQDFYEPIPTGMTPSGDLDRWVEWATHLHNGGHPEQLSELMAHSRLDARPETSFSRLNLASGLRAPLSGSFRNPIALSAEGWIRQLYWSLVLPSHRAAVYAYWDSLTDQASDSATIASLLAACFDSAGPVEWVRRMIGLSDRLPAARQVVRHVANAVAGGQQPSAIAQQLPQIAATTNPLDCTLNLGFVTLALLSGAGDFGKSLCHAAACGGASHSVAAYCGALVARWNGSVPEPWLKPLGGQFRFHTQTLAEVWSIEEFGDRVKQSEPSTPVVPLSVATVVVEDSTTGYAIEHETELPPPLPTAEPTAVQIDIPSTTSRSSAHCVGDLLITVQYEEPPIAYTDRALQCVVSVENRGEEALLDPRLSWPEGWQVAHRLTSFRLAPGAKQTFAVVMQPKPEGGVANLHLGGSAIPLVALPRQLWSVCGPFPNLDGLAFERVFKCEDVLNTSEVFAGRAGAGVKWRNIEHAGIMMDVESYFQGQPGVIYLYQEFELTEPGKIRLVAAGSPGVVVKVNREPTIKYNHTHEPIPYPMAPYLGSFAATGRMQILVKLIREREPMAPLTLYMLDEQNDLVSPHRYFPLSP